MYSCVNYERYGCRQRTNTPGGKCDECAARPTKQRPFAYSGGQSLFLRYFSLSTILAYLKLFVPLLLRGSSPLA